MYLCKRKDKIVMKKVKTILLRILRIPALKYIVVTILAVVLIGFVDDNSVWHHIRNKQYISELEDEIGRYNAAYERDQAQIRELNRNPKAMEKIARERYFMKADDEDIFVLSDDDRTPKPIVNNETAE